MNVQGVVDHDGHRQLQQPGAVFALRGQRLATLEKTGWKIAGALRAELRVIAVADVAKVPGKIHRLVVAMHDMHRASGRRCFPAQAHQQVHHLLAVIAAVQQVAERHQVRFAARPAELPVNQPGALQQRHQLLIGAMDVADHDHAFDTFKTIGPGRELLRRQQQAEPQQPECKKYLPVDHAQHYCPPGSATGVTTVLNKPRPMYFWQTNSA